MHKYLENLIEAEEAAGSPIRRHLRPGLPESIVRDRLQTIGLQAPVELIELYGWRDGVDQAAWHADGHQNDLCLFPSTQFTPLDDSISDYLDLKSNWQRGPWYEEYQAGRDPGWGYWRTEWFPVFWSEKSRHAVDCGVSGANPVWHVYFEPFPKTEPRHTSLTALAQDLADHFRRGDCTWSAERQKAISTLDYDL